MRSERDNEQSATIRAAAVEAKRRRYQNYTPNRLGLRAIGAIALRQTESAVYPAQSAPCRAKRQPAGWLAMAVCRAVLTRRQYLRARVTEWMSAPGT
jgi:hypothetical protein